MLEQPIELLLVEIELMCKTLLHCVTPNNNMQISVAHYCSKWLGFWLKFNLDQVQIWCELWMVFIATQMIIGANV